MRFFPLVAVFSILIGCGSSPSPVLPPLELTPLQNKIEISRQWKFTVGDGVSDLYLKLAPVFEKNTGYVIDYKGQLKTFSVDRGKIINEYNLNIPVSAGLVISKGKLFLGTSKGEIISLNASNAKETWRTQLSSEILSRPAIAKGIVVVKTIDGRVYGLNVSNGKKV
ncbi:MAG: PQQ-binding-like beta-propeller repeat protein, partial [Gammaproteobacteria bacterium]|nr:PQQ-binding-like beta-propeller repeat protein [Gammaproteobacteria bacterium]